MTRFLIAVLLVLNAATLAWQWDAFARWGYGPNTAREPERLTQQIRPEALTVETPAETAARIASEAAKAASEAQSSESSGSTAVVSTDRQSASASPASPRATNGKAAPKGP